MRSDKDKQKNLSTSLDPDCECSTKTLHSSDCYGACRRKKMYAFLLIMSLSPSVLS